MRSNKYIIVAIFSALIVISLLLCSCSFNKNSDNVIDSNRNYKVTENKGSFGYNIVIYDDDGNTLYSEENIDRPVSLSESNSLITISVDYGTGLQAVRFFDLNRREISDTFSYVISNNDNSVAYINADSLNERTVVIRNIFDKNILYYETKIDFANIDTPVEKAEFIDNNNLKITYENSVSEIQETVIEFQ